MMVGYVYLLHFTNKLSHAQHYVGCTHDLRQRLITHAQGRGARIVEALLDDGGAFEVGAVGTTTAAGLRKLERQVKNWHNHKEFCELCSDTPRKLPGTTPYPLTALPFADTSDILRHLSPAVTRVDIRFTTPHEPIILSSQIKVLAKQGKDALGFIPAGGDGGVSLAILAGHVAVCEVDGVLRGYCLFTVNEQEKIVRIQQLFVEDAYRRCGYGGRMIAAVARKWMGYRMGCRVRDDLPANDFWTRIGFAEVGRDTHDTSASCLIVYERSPYYPHIAGV